MNPLAIGSSGGGTTSHMSNESVIVTRPPASHVQRCTTKRGGTRGADRLPGRPARPFADVPGVDRALRASARILAEGLVLVVRCYQGMIRPHLVGSCKFLPTCSEYAIEALRTHGPLAGTLLALRRLARCHPFTPGHLDPVPPPTSASTCVTNHPSRS